MKISKLFHWLYACLILLPIAVFLPTGLYYAFNKEAVVNSETKEVYETKQINFNQLYEYTAGGFNNELFVVPNNNFLDIYGHSTGTKYYQKSIYITGHKYINRINVSNNIFSGVIDFYLSGTYVYSYSFTAENNYTVENLIEANATNLNINIRQSFDYTEQEPLQVLINVFDLTQMFGAGNEPTIAEFNSLFPNSYYNYTLSSPMTITIDTGETKQYIDIVSNISSAWDDVWRLPLFSWSGNSFLTAPFNYITSLFGMPNNSTFVYALSYWLAISLVYLVFDIIMYVPLLVHRLIDKARIE